MRSIYFNGYREKRKRGIFSQAAAAASAAASNFSSMMDTSTALKVNSKIKKWIKNTHTYAIFNNVQTPSPAGPAAASPVITEDKECNYLESLCYKFKDNYTAEEEEEEEEEEENRKI